MAVIKIPTEEQKRRACERSQVWYAANRERALAYHKNRYQENPEAKRLQSAAWRKANPVRASEGKKRCYLRRREHYLAKSYQGLCTEKRKTWARAYVRRRYLEPQYQQYTKCVAYVGQIISGRINGLGGSKFFGLLGCSVSEFRSHLESKFTPGMTWNNRGRKRGCWQVDHVIEASKFDLTDENQLARFFHYTNTQPLWADENNRKRGGVR